MANLFGTMCTKFYENQMGYVEDMTKTYWCFFFDSQCINCFVRTTTTTGEFLSTKKSYTN